MNGTNRNRVSLKDRIDESRRATLSIAKDFQKDTYRYVSGYIATTSLDHEIFPDGAAELLTLIMLKARNTKDGVIKLSYREVTERLGMKRKRQEKAIRVLLRNQVITREENNDFFSHRRVFKYTHDRYEQIRNAYVQNEAAREAAKAAAEPKTWGDWLKITRERMNGGQDKQAPQIETSDQRDELLDVVRMMAAEINVLKEELGQLTAKSPTTAPHLLLADEKTAKTEESAQMYKRTNDLFQGTNELFQSTYINNTISKKEVKEKVEECLFKQYKELKDNPAKEGMLVVGGGGAAIPAALPALPAPVQQILEKHRNSLLEEYGSDLTQIDDPLLKSLKQDLNSRDMKVEFKSRITDRITKAVNVIEKVAAAKKVDRPRISYGLRLEQASVDSLYYTALDAITTGFWDGGVPTLSLPDLETIRKEYSTRITSVSTESVMSLAAAFRIWMVAVSESSDYQFCDTAAMNLSRQIFEKTIGLSDALVALLAWKDRSWYSPGYVVETAGDIARFRQAFYGIKPLDVIARSTFFNVWGRVDMADRRTIHAEKIELPNTDSKKSKVKYQVFQNGLPLLVAEFIHAYPGYIAQKSDALFMLDLAFLRVPHFVPTDFRYDAFDFWFGESGEALPAVEKSTKDGRVSPDIGYLAALRREEQS